MVGDRIRFADQYPPSGELGIGSGVAGPLLSPPSDENNVHTTWSRSSSYIDNDDKFLDKLDLTRKATERRSVLQEQRQEEQRISERHWMPWALNFWVMIGAAVLIAVMGIVLEILLAVNTYAYGWAKPSFWSDQPGLHVLWTAIPSLIATLLVLIWTSMDEGVKTLQPYIDLSKGEAAPEKTVLLSYTRSSRFLVWIQTLRNGHWYPTITNTLVLLTLLIGPLAGALLYLDVPPPDFLMTLNDITSLGMLEMQDLGTFAGFSNSAGFVAASVSFPDIQAPAFIRFQPGEAWTSGKLKVNEVTSNGTVTAQTVCIRSTATCTPATVSSVNGVVTGTNGTCSFNQTITDSVGQWDDNQFGITQATCQGFPTTVPEFQPLGIWHNMNRSQNLMGLICTPYIYIQRADAQLNVTSNALLTISNQVPLLPSDQQAADMNAPPFNGHGYNGLLLTPGNDTHRQAHQNATLFSVGHAISQNFTTFDSTGSNADTFRASAEDALSRHLGMVASLFYFTDQPQPITGMFHATDQRLFISGVATHLLAVILWIIAIVTTILAFLHARERRAVRLASEPGSLAAAVSITGQTELAKILDGKDSEREMAAMLSDLKFSLDPGTGRIQVDDEASYGDLPPRNVYQAKRFSRLRDSGRFLPRSPGISPRSPLTHGTNPSPSPRTEAFHADLPMGSLEKIDGGLADDAQHHAG